MFDYSYSHDTNHETEQYGPYFQTYRTNSLPRLTVQQRSANSHLGIVRTWINRVHIQIHAQLNTPDVQLMNVGKQACPHTHTFIEKKSVRNQRLAVQLKKRISTLAWQHQIQQQWLLSSSWVSQTKIHSLASLGLAREKLDHQSNTKNTLFQPP